MTAVRKQYRRPFQLAAALFAVGVLAGFAAAPHRQDVDRGARLPGKAAGKGENAAGGGASDGALDRVIKALSEERDVDKANRIMAEVDWNELMAPRPPRLYLSEILASAWFAILFCVVADTLLCIALGFLLGIYPGVSTVAMGAIVGAFLSKTIRGEGGWTFSVWGVLILSVWLVLVLVSLLSAAIGFDMARYIAQRNKGEWFLGRIRMGLEVWSTAVAPATVAAMVILAIVFAIAVKLSGDPVLR